MSASARREDTLSSSSSSDLTTSREVLENVYHLDQQETGSQEANKETSTTVSSPTTSDISESRSTTDVPSEVLVSQAENLPAGANADRITSASGGQVHGHLLPSGWACNYYPNTDEYRFEYSQQAETSRQGEQKQRQTQDRSINVKTPTRDDVAQTSRRPTLNLFECQYGYHFPTSPTSSMISELAKQVQKSSATGLNAQPSAPRTRQVGYGKNKLTLPTDEEEQARRLRDMFPTATAQVIEHMIRVYHGREGLIKAALISYGYKRSTEYSTQQAAAQSPIMLMMSKPASKKLFDKLVSYFPDKDEFLIKSLMYKHKEVEHEIISALVESFKESHTRDRARSHVESALKLDQSGTIMKLRYLKSLYPNCEEIEIYHLLNCNDLNAQKVMEIIERRGHKRSNIEEVLKNRMSQTQQMRAQQTAHAAKEKACANASDLVEAHVKRTKPLAVQSRVNNLKANLMKSLDNVDDGLALAALEAADYNEALAKRFLEERQPVDEARYTKRYQLELRTRPDTIAFPCKSIQKSDVSFMAIVSNESVHIPRDVIECKHALALLKIDAATFTGDDFPKVKVSQAQGRQYGLNRGPTYQRQRELQVRKSLQVGHDSTLRCGTMYKELTTDASRAKPGWQARGHNKDLPRGHNSALRCGHNAKLLERVHPFFKPQA